MTVEIRGEYYRVVFTKEDMDKLRSQLPQQVFDCVVAAEADEGGIANA